MGLKEVIERKENDNVFLTSRNEELEKEVVQLRSEKDYFQHWKANAEDSLKQRDENILSQAT